jgi:hypothetical protein
MTRVAGVELAEIRVERDDLAIQRCFTIADV